jgi:N-dimethylarginine dimethylaminohydrolase
MSRMPPPGRWTRSPAARSFLMCRPDHFTVSYAINPWMDPHQLPDPGRARRQWDDLRAAYLRLGHQVEVIDPVPGLPDMVFAANGGTMVGGQVLGARFRHPQRAPEGAAFASWFAGRGYPVTEPRWVNEGEGDLVVAPGVIFSGYGFRSDPEAAAEAQELFGVPVVPLRLTDPRFYHLDTALCVLGADAAAYYPAAFDEAAVAELASRFAVLIEAKDEDAEVLGLNAVSDGRNVVLPARALRLADQIAAAGFEPVPVDLSEFLKAGGGPKCCTLELRQ